MWAGVAFFGPLELGGKIHFGLLEIDAEFSPVRPVVRNAEGEDFRAVGTCPIEASSRPASDDQRIHSGAPHKLRCLERVAGGVVLVCDAGRVSQRLFEPPRAEVEVPRHGLFGDGVGVCGDEQAADGEATRLQEAVYVLFPAGIFLQVAHEAGRCFVGELEFGVGFAGGEHRVDDLLVALPAGLRRVPPRVVYVGVIDEMNVSVWRIEFVSHGLTCFSSLRIFFCCPIVS